MPPALRLLTALALLAALAPLAAAQGVDCSNVPLSAGPVDHAYAACAQQEGVAPPAEDPWDFAFGINNSAAQFVRFQLNAPGTLINVGPYTPPAAPSSTAATSAATTSRRGSASTTSARPSASTRPPAP